MYKDVALGAVAAILTTRHRIQENKVEDDGTEIQHLVLPKFLQVTVSMVLACQIFLLATKSTPSVIQPLPWFSY